MRKSENFNDFSEKSEENLSIKAKILTFSKISGVRISTIADAMGISVSNFRGKNFECSLNSDVVVAFLDSFPQVSAEWLMRGKEPMILTDSKDSISAIQESRELNVNNGVNNGHIGSQQQIMNLSPSEDSNLLLPCGRSECYLLDAKQELINAQKLTIELLRNSNCKI